MKKRGKMRKRWTALLSGILAVSCALGNIPVSAAGVGRGGDVMTTENLAVGCAYSSSVTPNADHNDTENKKLTDEVIGTNNFYEVSWVGYSFQPTVDIVVDLGKQKTFSAVEIVTLNNAAGGIKHPLSVAWAYSGDGQSWNDIVSESFPADAPQDSVYTYHHDLPVPVTAQFVKLSFPADRWVFLSEIRVLGEKAVEIDPNNVIQNISYTTSLSESDFVSGYTDLDRTKLSDGIIGDRVTWKNSKSVGMNLPSAGEIPISFAFSELKTVRQINFSVYQERNKNIFFPSSVLIEYQDAGDQWQEWCNAYIPPSNSSYCELVCIAPENIMAKGVRFSFVLDKGSLFMDEIQVLSQVDGKTDNMTGNDPPKPPATDENNLIGGVKYVTNLKDGDANAGLGDFSGEGDLTRSKLTDGIKAPYGTNWSDKAFLLMHWATGVEDKRVHISFDFGGAKTFQQINIGTFGGASGIYIPEKALIEYQNENGTWQSLYDGQLPTSNVEMFKQLVYVVPNNGSITAKGIRFAFTIAGSWMCVDEMEVLNQADGSIPNINPPTGASEKPTFTTDLPTSKSVQTNKAVTLTVEATVSDGGTLSYQWYKGSQKIGTNSNIYTIANAASDDSGNYRVVVTNTLAGKYNTAESTNCYLTVSGEEPPKPAETNLLSGISYVTSFQDGDANLGMGDFHGDHPDSNRTRLTDGIMAAAWGDPATVGYNLKSAEKPLDLQFSLGKATKFQEIQLGAFGGDSGITTPSSMKIEVKNGDGNWHLIFDGKTPGKAPGTRYVFTSVYEQDITATDIRFTIDSTESWVFLDEVQLFSKTTGMTSFADLEMDYKPMENNLVAGKAYEVSAEASPSYPDSGHKELTDGKYGAANYSNGEWVGFIDYTGVTPVDIIFDLGSVKTFEEVKFNNLCSKNVGIKLLKGAQIFVSDDQQNWKQVLDYAITPTTSSLMIYNFKYTAYHSIQARYVKLAIGMSGWGFIDEVEILAQSEDNLGDNSNNVALHKKYSSTPKADPAYADTSSLSKLTDGRMSVADFSQLAWVGYSKSGENTEIIVDLEEDTSFEQVGIHFLNDGNNQILLPANVDVTYSLDQSSWTSFASSSIQPISSEAPVVYQYQATIPNGTAAAKGRYVKFSFPTSEKVFLNEIQIFKNKTISNDGESADPLPMDPNNLANGCSYTTSWAAETSHSDDGKLTNGTRANPSHLDRQWVGYQTKEPNAGSAFDITVDLGSVKSFEQVKIGFLEAVAQEFNVNIPAEITVQYSNNQSAWSSYQARTALSRKEGYTVLRFCTEAAKPVSARYVRFTLLLKATAFIDEIEILEKFVQGEDASTNPDNGETVNLVRGSDKVGASRPADFRNSAEVLTDGLYGITGTKYDQNWMGFKSSANDVNNHVQVDFDLMTLSSVSKIVLNSRHDAAKNLTIPKNVKFYISYNNKTWALLNEAIVPTVTDGTIQLTWDGGTDGFMPTVSGATTAYGKYVRVEFDVPETGYAYLDEVQIFGKKGKCSNASFAKDSDGLYNLAAEKSYKVLPFRGPTLNPDVDDTELTDCVFGTESMTDPAWSELNQNEMLNNHYSTRYPLKKIIVDLGDTKTITTIRLELLGVFDAGFRRPWCVFTYASMDGVTWTPLSKNYTGGIWGSGLAAYGWNNTDSSGTDKDLTNGETMMTAKYVRVDVEPWISALASEIEVMGYDGQVEGAAVAENGRLLDDGREFQKKGEDTANIRDLVLCYNGYYKDVDGKPGFGNWSAEQFRPYLTYINHDGEAADTMFDGILLLGLWSQYGRPFMQTGDSDHVQAEDWIWYLDKTFNEGGDVYNLNEAAKKAAEELGDPNYKAKLVVMDPGIYHSHTHFGSLDGSHDLNFQEDADWKFASDWYLSEVERRFKEGNYEHVEFSGYYWLDEQYGFGETLWYQEYHKQWIQDHGYKFFWIPMSPANGYLWGHDVGFDAIAFQPGHYFSTPYQTSSKGYLGKEYVQNCIDLASYGNMTIEFEMDNNAFTHPETYNQFLDYLNAANDSGLSGPDMYRNWYQDVRAMGAAAFAGNEKVRALYDYAYQMMQGTYTNQPYITERELGEDPLLGQGPGGSNGGGTSGGDSSTGESGGGSARPERPTDPEKPSVGKLTWEKTNGVWKLKGDDGKYMTGWKKVDGNWYYMNDDAVMQKGWQKIGGKWYYLKDSGAMATGWVRVGNHWYYLNESGIMKTGWQKLGNTWYYLKDSGAMVTGWHWIGNKCYYFDAGGKMAANTTIGGYKIGVDGAWIR